VFNSAPTAEPVGELDAGRQRAIAPDRAVTSPNLHCTSTSLFNTSTNNSTGVSKFDYKAFLQRDRLLPAR
jgi:hypothetical protein